MNLPYSKLCRVSGESLESYGTPKQTSEGERGTCYHDFSTGNLPTCLSRIVVSYMWQLEGLQRHAGGPPLIDPCSTSGTKINYGGPPLETWQRVWSYRPQETWTVPELRPWYHRVPLLLPRIVPRMIFNLVVIC